MGRNREEEQGQPTLCLSLEEVRHIRTALTRAELEVGQLLPHPTTLPTTPLPSATTPPTTPLHSANTPLITYSLQCKYNYHP